MSDPTSLPRRFLPSIASLRAMEALDRLGTATAAAEELNLTQSAVSRQIQALEDQLGAELLHRSKRRMHPTEQGARYAAEIRGALAQIAKASMQVHTGTAAHGISLAILPSFGMRWLVPRLAGFARLHPDVPVNMSTRLAHESFELDPFDAAIRYGVGQWTGCGALLLSEERILPVCSPDFLDEPVHSASDLADMSLLHIETRPRAWTDWLSARGAHSRETSGAWFDQFSTITQAAIHGLGVALLPDFIAEPEIAAGRLVPAFGGYSPSDKAYFLVWPDSKAGSPGVRLFRDWIATQTEDNLPR